MDDPARWPQGAHVIEGMIDRNELQRVEPSVELAEHLLDEATRHLASAELLAEVDPSMAYDSLYSAARKAMAAVLARQGLRATARGGHVAVEESLNAQLGEARRVVEDFTQLRRQRNLTDYPGVGTPPMTTEVVNEDLPAAQRIVEAMQLFLRRVGPF